MFAFFCAAASSRGRFLLVMLKLITVSVLCFLNDLFHLSEDCGTWQLLWMLVAKLVIYAFVKFYISGSNLSLLFSSAFT